MHINVSGRSVLLFNKLIYSCYDIIIPLKHDLYSQNQTIDLLLTFQLGPFWGAGIFLSLAPLANMRPMRSATEAGSFLLHK